MSDELIKLGMIDITPSEYSFIVRTLENAWKRERGRISGYKAHNNKPAQMQACGDADDLERVLLRLGWKGTPAYRRDKRSEK